MSLLGWFGLKQVERDSRFTWFNHLPGPSIFQTGDLLWMDEIHFAPLRNHGKPLFVGIYRGFESETRVSERCEMEIATLHSIAPLPFPHSAVGQEPPSIQSKAAKTVCPVWLVLTKVSTGGRKGKGQFGGPLKKRGPRGKLKLKPSSVPLRALRRFPKPSQGKTRVS